jgi:hypothetical protein
MIATVTNKRGRGRGAQGREMQHEAGNEGGMSSSERIMAAYEAGSKQELRLFWHSVARRCAALRITFGRNAVQIRQVRTMLLSLVGRVPRCMAMWLTRNAANALIQTTLYRWNLHQ